MDRKELIQQIKEKQSFLCVGLDTDLTPQPPIVWPTNPIWLSTRLTA